MFRLASLVVALLFCLASLQRTAVVVSFAPSVVSRSVKQQRTRTTTAFPLARFALGTDQQHQQQESKDQEQETTTEDATIVGVVVNKNNEEEQETTEKFGLEAGLFKAFKKDDAGESAKTLLKKYGIAYLATSIPLAAISFGLCYLLVDNGVDVGAMLAKLGIEGNETGEKAGTFAIAYATHKAASPIRFPPTVILTPLVAKLIGKEPEVAGEEEP
jgi:hypothetical protein